MKYHQYPGIQMFYQVWVKIILIIAHLTVLQLQESPLGNNAMGCERATLLIYAVSQRRKIFCRHDRFGPRRIEVQKGGPQVAWMLQAKPGRSGKQQQ